MAYIALALHATLVAVAARHHEPWSDEAQAWLLARDASVPELFGNLLRMEGSPGLWHAILILPAKLGLPYRTINVISAALAVFAAFLVLKYSPFPLPVRVLLPFTFFLSYQYAVVARSYALLPPLVFSIAMSYPQAQARPYRFMTLLALLANVSAQSFLLAGSLAAVHAFDLFKARKALGKPVLWKHARAMVALALVMGMIVLQLANSSNVHFGNKGYVFNAGLFRTISAVLLKTSMVESTLLTTFVLALSIWWFWRTKVLLLYLLPTASLLVFASVVYSNAWHEGIPFLVWVLVLWISLQKTEPASIARSGEDGRPGARSCDLWVLPSVLAGMFVVLTVQAGWAVSAFRYDLTHPYSGSLAAARYIENEGLHKRVLYAVDFPSIALLPYFEENIYDNLNQGRNVSFWDWSTSDPMLTNPQLVLENRPDAILQSVTSIGLDGAAAAAFPGYQAVACFPGALAWKHGPREIEAYLLFLRDVPGDSATFVPRTSAPVRYGCMAAG